MRAYEAICTIRALHAEQQNDCRMFEYGNVRVIWWAGLLVATNSDDSE